MAKAIETELPEAQTAALHPCSGRQKVQMFRTVCAKEASGERQPPGWAAPLAWPSARPKRPGGEKGGAGRRPGPLLLLLLLFLLLLLPLRLLAEPARRVPRAALARGR